MSTRVVVGDRKSGTGRYLRAVTPFPQTTNFSIAISDMVTELNGFVYAGDRLNAVCDTIKWLRTHPGEALFLLTYEGPDD